MKASVWPEAMARGALLPAASAVVAGLYLGRLWSELQPRAHGRAELAGAVAGGLVLGALAVLLLRAARADSWPLLILGAYAFWPQASPRLALAAGVVGGVALVLAQRRLLPRPGDWLEPLVCGGALALYVATLAPSVQPADAGEFQLVATVLGIAHPPGYPLYTLLGKAFTLLPAGDPAWRVNLFAAVAAAATLAVVCRAVRRVTGSAAAGVLAALALGVAPTFWSQATLANVRSLTALLTALAIYWLLCYGETHARSHLLAFAITFGLGITHHSSIILLGLPFLAYLLAVDPRLFVQPRRWAAPLLGLGGSLLVLLYLPLRSAMNPPFDTPSVRTLSGFLAHVLALGFRGDFLYFLGRPILGLRGLTFAGILRIEFGWPLLIGMLALGLLAGWRRWPWLLLWGGVAAVNSLAAITYRAPQTVEYLLPTYVALAIGFGLGLGQLFQKGPGRPFAALLGGAIAWLALANGLAAYPSYLALHCDDSTRRQAVEFLQAAPPGALILSNWHQATPLWYLQQVEGLRRDVQVSYVYPEGSTPNGEVWVRRIRQAAGQRAVLVTNRFPEYAALPYRFTALGEGWLVQAVPARDLGQGFSGAPQALGDKVKFMGVRLEQTQSAPGQTVSLQVAWQPLADLERDYSWFVHLEGPQGIAGQADITYGAGRVPVGEILIDGYRFSLRPDTPPGDYRLIGGVYITFPDGHWERLRTADGQDAITLGSIHVRPRPEAPPTAHPLDIAWAEGSRLVGVDYDDSVAGQRRVYLHWQRPGGAPDLDLTLLAQGQPAARLRLPGAAEAGYQTVACTVSPAAGPLALQAAAGHQVPALGPWHRADGRPIVLPAQGPGARYLDLGGEMALVGAHWQPGIPAAGAPWRAELEFVAERALLKDYTVSLSLEGDGWRAQDDGTPALGAIPTLKWLAGWRIDDTRLIEVPAEAAGPARLRLTVYDAFTLAPLPVGDDRLAKAGQGVQATLWEGVIP